MDSKTKIENKEKAQKITHAIQIKIIFIKKYIEKLIFILNLINYSLN